MGLYADPVRGRYPVWQSLDHPDFLPGSGILFVTVTVSAIIIVCDLFRPHWSLISYASTSDQGDFSQRIEVLSDAQVKDEVMDIVRAMFNNVTVPEPIAFHFPRWHSDPLFRGSYSNWPPSFVSEHQQNLRATVQERLWFAGEHTDAEHFGKLLSASGTPAPCIMIEVVLRYQQDSYMVHTSRDQT